jgi:hypothetical protein
VFHSGACVAPPLEQIDDEAQRRLDGIAPGVLRHVLLQNVVLHRAAQLRARDALALRRRHVKAEQDHGGPLIVIDVET